MNTKDKKTTTNYTKNEMIQALDRLEEHLWATNSFFLLLLDSLGVEIIDDQGFLPSELPVFIKCPYELALKVNKNGHFNTELCGESLWKIGVKYFDYHEAGDHDMVRMRMEEGKERLTRKAEYWIDSFIDKGEQERNQV